MMPWRQVGSAFKSPRRITTRSDSGQLPQTSRGPDGSGTIPLPPSSSSALPLSSIFAASAAASSAASFLATLFFTCEACIAKRSVLMLSLMESAACVTHAMRAVLLLPPRPGLRICVSGWLLYGMNLCCSISDITTRPRAVNDWLIDVASSNPLPVTPLRSIRSLPAKSTINIDASSLLASSPGSTKRSIKMAWLRLETSFMSWARVARRFAPNSKSLSTWSAEVALWLVTFCKNTLPSLSSTIFS
mmetsp:Transcript_52114/g.93656  ORF Transcript_52114/g.93656 Transcript_52114/m.93656 type:complete len:246 (-) Transcript_52114:852-1589(-)